MANIDYSDSLTQQPGTPGAIDYSDSLVGAPGTHEADVQQSLAAYDANQQRLAPYQTTGQTAAAYAEGAGRGIVGPFAPLAERALGVPAEDIRARREANPIAATAGEVTGFVAPALLTGGASAATRLALPGVVSGAGHAAAEIAASIGLPKLAQLGVRTGIEMAALQGSDELSKMVTEDPGQTLGSAVANIGLAGTIGGFGGVAIGGIAPLIGAATDKVGVSKFIDDAKGQYNFRQTNPDLVGGAHAEIQQRVDALEQLRSQMGDLKGESLSRAMPEVSEKASAKISAQTAEIAQDLAAKIKKAQGNVYLKGAAPGLEQHLNDFLEVANNPEAGYIDKFNAIDNLKREMQGLSRYGLTAEDTARGSLTKGIAADLRQKLEDSSVWGEAGNVQKDVNKAITDNIKSSQDFEKKFTSKVMEERVVDPAKIQTYLNQASKSKAGIKTDVVSNYLENSQNLVDTINNVHTNAGLEPPVPSMEPTPILNQSLNNVTNGTKLGNWLYDQGLASFTGQGAGAAAGSGLGSLVGHPAIGATLGARLLGPMFTSIAKPLLEKATQSEGMRAAVGYIAAAAKGQAALSGAARTFFEHGVPVIARNLMPTQEDNVKLDQQLANMKDINQALNIGQGIAHYLPEHAQAMATTAGIAQNYLASLKPVQPQLGALDGTPPINKAQQAKYERALSIAHNPLVAMQYAKDGTLMASDVQTLNTLYPGLHKAMLNKLTTELVEAKNSGKYISYAQRAGLNTLMGGGALASAMSPQAAQAIIASARTPSTPQSSQHGVKATGQELKTIGKVNDLYATRSQQREMGRRR